MKCYSLTLGARNSGARTFSRADERAVRGITARHFPEGFTILHGDGGWFDPRQRKFLREASRQILVCAPNLRRIRPWCRALAQALRQQELLVIELGPITRFRASARRVRAQS